MTSSSTANKPKSKAQLKREAFQRTPVKTRHTKGNIIDTDLSDLSPLTALPSAFMSSTTTVPAQEGPKSPKALILKPGEEGYMIPQVSPSMPSTAEASALNSGNTEWGFGVPPIVEEEKTSESASSNGSKYNDLHALGEPYFLIEEDWDTVRKVEVEISTFQPLHEIGNTGEILSRRSEALQLFAVPKARVGIFPVWLIFDVFLP